jgi:hypothetical protein
MKAAYSFCKLNVAQDAVDDIGAYIDSLKNNTLDMDQMYKDN